MNIVIYKRFPQQIYFPNDYTYNIASLSYEYFLLLMCKGKFICFTMPWLKQNKLRHFFYDLFKYVQVNIHV